MEQRHTFNSLGTTWSISVYDTLTPQEFSDLMSSCVSLCTEFDELYSRFKKTSLVTKLSLEQGEHRVPKDLVAMLTLYRLLYEVSDKKFTPCVGALLEDIGYDSEYSLVPKKTKRDTPPLEEVVSIIDEEHIIMHTPTLLDFGALGKGYCIDIVSKHLRQSGITRFLVNGSGDMFYEGAGVPITIGLEHPGDATKVIGSITMTSGAMCSSATNRRTWEGFSHYVDPHVKSSPKEIIATWVIAETAAIADAISSALFFVSPEKITTHPFSYCILNHEYKVKKSPDFSATFY